jgi:two-component system OmpR family response regulator
MNGQAPHIVVVDDEADARVMVGDYLRMHGFDVALCDGGRALRSHILQRTPDLVVLDLNMPEEDGLSIVRDLKARMALPIIMLTATASAIDRVVGLELGADDYLPKPCELRELVARVRSVLRRAQGVKAGPPATDGPVPAAPFSGPDARRVRFGTTWLDVDALRLRDDQGMEQALTRSEFDLLKAFADHPKRALSRERLLDLADARDPDAFDRAIDVRINRIRKKIEPDPANPRYIRTVRGLGYVFRPEGD